MPDASANVCPLCGKVNSEHEWLCEACGARLPSHGKREAVAAAPAPAPPQSAMVSTPAATVTAEATQKSVRGCVWGCSALFLLIFVLPVSCSILSPSKPKPTYTPSYTNTAPQTAPQQPVDACSYANAVCSDGSTSMATGRGACSRHGGVARWCR